MMKIRSEAPRKGLKCCILMIMVNPFLEAHQSRFWIEFKKNGNGRLLYDEEMGMIMYDHLISETNEPTKKFTYVPDGDYEAFKWVNGKWLHVEKVFTFKLLDGQAPVEKPLNENKLKPVKKG
jgi:hypothetical protein